MASYRHCPVPRCGEPVVVYVQATHAYPEHSNLIESGQGFRFRACALHESQLMDGLGDALDWATITRPGPPKTAIVGRKVSCGSRP